MVLKNYWWLLIWMFLFGAVSYLFIPRREEIVLGKACMRWGRLPAALLALPYVLWAAWRPDSFGDTGVYRTIFNEMPTGLNGLEEYVSSATKGHGFVVIEYLFKTLLSQDSVLFFLFIALIQIVLLVKIYRKYSSDYWLSMFLFVASADYMSWVHNGMRQFLAVTIIFVSLPLLLKKRYVLMTLMVLLAANIHSAALIFLPFIFVINGRAWNYRTILFILGLLLSILFLDKSTGFIAKTMENTSYENEIDDFINDKGTNLVRVVFCSLPAFFTWLFRDRINAKNDQLINLCTNLSIITAGMYVFSHFTSGIFVGAIPIFFSLANYILIPWLIQELFGGESALVVKGTVMVVYGAFFYYQMGTTWGLL